MKNFMHTSYGLFAVFMISAFFIGCSGGADGLAKKRIKQKIETDAMGMLKDVDIESVEKVNDTTYKAVHSFNNPIIKKEMPSPGTMCLTKG